jgi:hypothetical protein
LAPQIEDTRMQLELINQTLALLQSNQASNEPRPQIGLMPKDIKILQTANTFPLCSYHPATGLTFCELNICSSSITPHKKGFTFFCKAFFK